MRLSTILYLYRVRLRARFVQELLAITGIAVGVALLFASQVANTSLTGSVAHLTNGLIGKSRLQITARDPLGFNERLLVDVQRIPGVQVAAPVLERTASVVGPTGEASVDLIGIDSRFVGLEGQLLSHVSAAQIARQHGVALPEPIAQKIGVKSLQPITLRVGAQSMHTLVAIALEVTEIGLEVNSPIAILPLASAQQLTGMRGKVTRILVEPKPGEDREVRTRLLELAHGRLNVRPANFDASLFRQAEGPTLQSTELFSAISALVGFLFAFNAMLLTVPQRRNLITDLRLDGYTPLEIVEVMLFDALALGLMGSLLGLGLGELLSRGLLEANPGYLSFAFPVGSVRIVNWQSVAIATLGGLLAAVVGVTFPLRGEILGRRPLRQVTPRVPLRASTMMTLGGGLLCIALTTVLLWHGLSSVRIAVLSFSFLLLALLLILPVAFGAALILFDRIQRPVMGVSPRIAVIELQSSATRARSLAIAATGAIAVFGSVSIEGAKDNLSSGLGHSAADLSRGTDLWVTPAGGSTTLATMPFVNIFLKDIERLSVVEQVGIYRGGFLDVGTRRVLVVAPPVTSSRLLPASQLIHGNLTLATSRIRKGGWMALSRELADEHHLHLGERFTLPTPRPTAFRLAATITNLGWSPGAVILNADDYAQAWGSPDPSAYQVDLKPGVSIGRGLHDVQDALHGVSALVVQTAAQHESNDVAAQKQGLSRLTQIAALVLVAAALAMATAMGAMIWQRRPRLAGMKVDGFDEGELWRALLCESALLLGTGCSIGAIFGLYGQLLLSHALVSVTGFPVVFSVGVVVALVSIASVTSIAVAIVALPGYLAAQVKPALQD
jgi:putative ABC transport system permease protein